ncbi:hypothetical protein [Actinomycetospora soli]|uniref:hypothetical protein n=1 Tax=Actinomycetospora soli TaxID=2893887 RepID=UPI001E64FED0|nr:hypothetical protein [Actinomycetospora soli]MCD2189328.1 hypothetical protein [Actinomycetospora soli]
MSILRNTVLATVVVGAGLGAMSGSALAWDHHGDAGKSCSNSVKAASENGAGSTLGDTTGGSQDIAADNLCDIANGNEVLSGNNVAGGDIRNGDLTDITRTSDTTTTEESTTTVPAAPVDGGAGGGLPILGDLLGL